MLSNKVIIRSESAGVFFGEIKELIGDTVTLSNARRIWYWDGAASLSQLSVDGTKKPKECKFPAEMIEVTVFNVCEIIKCTKKAEESINAVPIWSA